MFHNNMFHDAEFDLHLSAIEFHNTENEIHKSEVDLEKV